MTALLIVDVQNDFLPGGALPVKKGDLIIPPINRLMEAPFNLIVASQDWHPKDHGSFAENHPGKSPGELIKLEGIDQVLWPVHCVQNTEGAKLASQLNSSKIDKIIYKGEDPAIDSYSAFFDNDHRNETGLDTYLKEKAVQTLYVVGLATDYCVKFTVLDALSLGYKVFFVEDGCRGIDLQEGDCFRSIEEIRAKGAEITSSEFCKFQLKGKLG